MCVGELTKGENPFRGSSNFYLIEGGHKFSKSEISKQPEKINGLLGNLYALRAGLSVISRQEDSFLHDERLNVTVTPSQSLEKSDCTHNFIMSLFFFIEAILILCISLFLIISSLTDVIKSWVRHDSVTNSLIVTAIGAVCIIAGILIFIFGNRSVAKNLPAEDAPSNIFGVIPCSWKKLRNDFISLKKISSEIATIKNMSTTVQAEYRQKFLKMYSAICKNFSDIIAEQNWKNLDTAIWAISEANYDSDYVVKILNNNSAMDKQINDCITRFLGNAEHSGFKEWSSHTPIGKEFFLCCTDIGKYTKVTCIEMFEALIEKRKNTSDELYSVMKSLTAKY